MGQFWRSKNRASKNIPLVYKVKKRVSIWLHIDRVVKPKYKELELDSKEQKISKGGEHALLDLVLLITSSFVILLGRAMNSVRAFGDESSAVLERLDGGGVLVHEIDLLQGETLGLHRRSASELNN